MNVRLREYLKAVDNERLSEYRAATDKRRALPVEWYKAVDKALEYYRSRGTWFRSRHMRIWLDKNHPDMMRKLGRQGRVKNGTAIGHRLRFLSRIGVVESQTFSRTRRGQWWRVRK